jgi:Flp pilus assembly protein protease CpaA
MLLSEGHVMPTVTLTLILVGMLALAALDIWRREVEDWAIIVLFAVAVVGLDLEGITLSQWSAGLLSAAIAFAAYMYLGQKGVLGGGDVKLSVVPAFVLGASHPLMGLLWILFAIVFHEGLMYLNSRVQKEMAAIPHVPAMALAALVASMAFPVSF